jgi:hypothetical protein
MSADLLATWLWVLVGCLLSVALGFAYNASDYER